MNAKNFNKYLPNNIMKPLLLFVLLALQAALPQFNEVAEHTFDGNAQLLCVADVDCSGTREILVWDSVASTVICYDCTGSPLWTVETSYPVVTAAAENVDDDASREIFILEEIGGDVYYSYRIMRVESDGTAYWRKLIEVDVHAELKFCFINADGKPGKEILIANKILLGEGYERLAFRRDRTIIAALEAGPEMTGPYFLVRIPDSGYELYTFDTEPLWQGQPCEALPQDLELVLCDLFYQAEVCACSEDQVVRASEPLMKAVRLWTDLDRDGTEEALLFTDSEVQLIDHYGTALWTWDSPEPIQSLSILDITGDGCDEIVVTAPLNGMHVPSVYILDSTGKTKSVLALNFSGIPSVLFSDLDGDGDPDLLTFDQGKKKSTLHIYTNTARKGQLDSLKPLNPLEVVDPHSFKTKFWNFYAAYRIPLIIVLVVALILAGIQIRRKS